ncbi:hypothetical protein BDY21DRAFT_108572 [Lineolata rhizophorae]|uniref:Uncharacterized protein n=1 Tax=Lineolata rhizophorae TaxID=578093 RepID=A0A6A6NR89_9PEZI|nr:hypothetical protein BDY21DRAFT_108572 [Lineolata rhizophorae]
MRRGEKQAPPARARGSGAENGAPGPRLASARVERREAPSLARTFRKRAFAGAERCRRSVRCGWRGGREEQRAAAAVVVAAAKRRGGGSQRRGQEGSEAGTGRAGSGGLGLAGGNAMVPGAGARCVVVPAALRCPSSSAPVSQRAPPISARGPGKASRTIAKFATCATARRATRFPVGRQPGLPLALLPVRLPAFRACLAGRERDGGTEARACALCRREARPVSSLPLRRVERLEVTPYTLRGTRQAAPGYNIRLGVGREGETPGRRLPAAPRNQHWCQARPPNPLLSCIYYFFGLLFYR